MTVSEQALVEAIAAKLPTALNEPWAVEILAALRAALGPDTVLTSEGVARVEGVDAVLCDWQGVLPRTAPSESCDRPLYTLTLENET